MNFESYDALVIRRCKVAFRSIAILFGAVQVFFDRNGFNPDSQSYLEVARAYLRHDWAMAINAHWSPLYPWLAALTLRIAKPSLRWEFPLLHLLNLLLFVICIMGFEFFWSGLLTAQTLTRAPSQPENTTHLPHSVLWILGYSLFIWLSVGSIIGMLGADLGVATVTLFVAGLLTRLHASNSSPLGVNLHVWLGIGLGLGYLTKAVMFPAALVFLSVAFLLQLNRPKNVVNVGLALLIFASIAAPQVMLLSNAKGRFTFSDSGKLTYAWSNYNLPLVDWQGQPKGSGIPLHPTRMVYEHPQMFEFNGPIRASYPPWYDPSYWDDGMSPTFNFRVVCLHFFRNIGSILLDLTRPRIWILGIIILIVLSDPRDTVRSISSYWYLLIPATSVLAAYALTFAEFRYLPAWLLMIWGPLLAGLRLRRRLVSPFILKSIAVVMAAVMMASIAYGLYGQSKSIHHADASDHYAIAEGLTSAGLHRGDKVGAIGFDNDAYWSYLDGLLIVAEIPTNGVCTFWNLPSSNKSDVLHRFKEAGAKAVIINASHHFKSTTQDEPFDFASCSTPDSGWRKIGDTEDYLYLIDRNTLDWDRP